MEKAIGLREKTLADYRKDFKITKDGDFYVITGYKGQNPAVFIPARIKDVPVQIGRGAFSGNEHIQSVDIEDGLTSIGLCAFSSCRNLQSVRIPNGVTRIEWNTFNYCKNLQSISLPGSVIYIGVCAFGGCNNLTISAPADSFAETYAKQNHIRFQAT